MVSRRIWGYRAANRLIYTGYLSFCSCSSFIHLVLSPVVPEEGNNERQDTEKETARKNSKSCNMPKSDSNFRQKYLVNTPMPGRIQVYLNRKLYDEIKNYLNVIAPEVSIASYISNIIAEHIELNIEEITRMYKDRFSPPKIQ